MVLLDKKGQKKQSFLGWFLGKKLKELPKVEVSAEPTLFQVQPSTEVLMLPEMKDVTTLDVRYPLIPPYAYAHIHWDAKESELVYELEEPVLNEKEKEILKMLEDGIKELINISFLNIKETNKVIEYLEKNLKVLLAEYKITITKETFLKMMYYLYRNFVGMNEIEPLMNDYFIEDVECNGSQTPIYIVHRKYRHIRTNIIFPDNRVLMSFVEKLAQKCGKYVSYASPLLDGALPDGSIDYEEPIIYKEGGIVKISKIGEFVDKYYKNNESNKPVSVKGVEVPAFDQKTLKISWKKLEYVYRHRINEDLFELQLEFGRKIRLTGCHSIFSLTKNGVISEKTDELKIGDYVAIPLTIPENDVIKEINVAEELSKINYTDGLIIGNIPESIFNAKKQEIKNYLNKTYKRPYQSYYEHKKKKILPLKLYSLLEEKDLRMCKIRSTSAVGIPTFIEVDKELIQLLGLYAAEGWTSKVGNRYSIYFSLNKKETNLIETIKNSAKKCFDLEVYTEPEDKNAVKVQINSYVLWILFNDVLKVSKGAKQKRIPELIFNVNKELQKEFLKHWSLGDYGSTASKNLADDISYLSLFNEDVVAFYDREREVLFNDVRKVKSYEYYTNFFVRGVNNAYPSMIPTEIFNPFKKTHHRLVNNRISKKRLNSILNEKRYKMFADLKSVNSIKLVKEWTKRGFIEDNRLSEKGKELLKEIDVINKLIQSDLGFAKIKSVSRVKSSNDFVYDLSVKDHENFIGGHGGVCCHNSRVNSVYTTDVSSRGPNFTIRKFTKEPWTPIKLMDFGTVSPEILAYLWLLIEHEANMIVIGGTSSGKTSFLNSLAFFIPPASRIVTIEDSVTGDTEILVKNRRGIQVLPIKEFVRYNRQKTNAQILTLDKDYKLKFVKPNLLLKHKTKKDVYKIITATGRIVEVTQDHSLFTLGERGLKETKPTGLLPNNSFIAVPRRIPYKGKRCTSINLLGYLNVFKSNFLSGKPVQKIFKEYKYKDFRVSKSKYQWWKNHNLIKINDLLKIQFKFTKKDLKHLKIKSKTQTGLPVLFKITKEFLELAGLWLGDGSYDRYNKNRVIISNCDKECIDLTKRIAKQLNFNISKMSDDVSLTINSIVFYKFMEEVIGLKGHSATKRIPEFIQNLSNKQIEHVVRGYFSADGCVKKYEVSCASQSLGLLHDLQTIFLRGGIISRITDFNRKDKCINLSISSHENVTNFKHIGFLQKRKNEKLEFICNRKSHHTVTDIIPLNIDQLKEVNKHYKISWPYLQGMQNIGRSYLQKIAPEGSLFNELSHSDILWDKVKRIEKLKSKERYAYDISVPETEKFVCSNVILHNTRELNLLHENWLPSVARAGVGMATITGERHGEVSLFDLLRESFRQRPDYVIVGEIRGQEAFVLFQGAASIKGDEKVLVLNDEHPKRIAIKDLKKNVRYKAITIDPKDGKVKILPVKFQIKHEPRSLLYKITTEKGREVVVTPDHSVFSYDNKIIPFRAEELRAGDNIIIPSRIPCGYANIDHINLLEELADIRIYAPSLIREAVKRLGYDKCCEICNIKAISDYYANFTKNEASALKAKKFIKLMEQANINYDLDDLKVRLKYSKKINPKLELSKEFLKLMGYYLSEGSLNGSGKNSKISFYNKDRRVLEDIRNCIQKVVRRQAKERFINRGYGTCTELAFSSKILYEFIKNNFGKKDEKKVADFIFGLSKEKIGWFLSGLWAGDGEMTRRRFGYYTISRNLANDVSQLLLVYGIVCNIRKRKRIGRTKEDYELLFYSREEKKRLLEYVKPVNKKTNLSKLRKMPSKKIIINDICIDKIKSISKINLRKGEPVYDISVPGAQNFIGGFGGLMLHNSGHPTMSTMHAESVDTMIKRLETPPISLSPALIETLNIVCVMIQTKVKGKPVRRLKEVIEIVSIPTGGAPALNTPFVRDPARDIFFYKTDSKMLDKISREHGIPKQILLAEWQRRINLLMAMYRKKMFGFKEVYEVINQYYKTPQEVLRRFGLK